MEYFRTSKYTGYWRDTDVEGINIDKMEMDGVEVCKINGQYYPCETFQFEEII